MKKLITNKYIISGLMVLIATGIFLAKSDFTKDLISQETTEYKNVQYDFGAILPAGFTSHEFSVEDSHTIIFQNTKGDGVQVIIGPYDDVKVLTEEMIKKDIPDMKITDVQGVEVGENHRGLAFLSDNSAFDGSSREVWFVFKGNLYQISTYARLDNLLKSIFATWKFE